MRKSKLDMTNMACFVQQLNTVTALNCFVTSEKTWHISFLWSEAAKNALACFAHDIQRGAHFVAAVNLRMVHLDSLQHTK